MKKIKKEFIKKNLLLMTNNNINDNKKYKFQYDFKGLMSKKNINNNYYNNSSNNQTHKKSLSLFLNSFNNNNNNNLNILPKLNISSFLKTINNNNESIYNSKYETLESKTERKKNNFSNSKFFFNSPGKINNIRNSQTKAKISMFNFQNNNNYSISTNNTYTLINNNINDNYNTIATSSKKFNSKIKKIIFENKKKINIKIIKKNLIKKEIKIINNNEKKFLKKLIFNLPINYNKKFTEKQIYLKKKKSKKNFFEKIKKCISNKIKDNYILNKNKINYNNNKFCISKILKSLFTSSFKFNNKIYINFNWYNLSYLNISINKKFSEFLSKNYFDIFNLICDFNNNNKIINKIKKNNSIKLINNFLLNSIFDNNNKNNIHHHSNSNCLEHYKNIDDIFYKKEIINLNIISKINKNFINLLCIKEWIYLSQKINLQSNKIIIKKKFKSQTIKSKPIIINYKNFDEKFIVLSNKHIFQKKQKEKTILNNIYNKQQSTKLNLFSKNNQIINKNSLRNSLTFSIQNNSSYKSDIPSEILSKLTDLLTKNSDNYFIYIFDKLTNCYNLNTLTLKGNTLLNLSCQLNNLIISKYLLNKGLNPNLRNYFGNYPLHYAIGHKNFELINELIKFGAKEDVYNKQGLTPWDILQSFYK